MACLNGQCVNNSKAPVGNCLFGDDLTTSSDIGNVITYPQVLLSCQDAIQLITANGLDPVYFCSTQLVSFGSVCCSSCAGNCYLNHKN